MNVLRLAAPASDSARCRVAKKIGPGRRGTVKLVPTHAEAPVVVGCRANADGIDRLTTVELVMERAVVQKCDDLVIVFKIKCEEIELRPLVQSKDAKYGAKNFIWTLARDYVLRMGLKACIAL